MSNYGDRYTSESKEPDKQRLVSELVKFTGISIYSSGRKLQLKACYLMYGYKHVGC